MPPSEALQKVLKQKTVRYLLNPNIALRSWQLVPYVYYIRGERNAQGLGKEEFEFLSACDGRTELPAAQDSPLAGSLLERGLIHAAREGEVLSSWSRPMVCRNRYFPAMNWMITGRCNYTCLHCFNAADNAPLMSEWSMDEAERLLDQARDCGINAFTVTGGEPMFHRHFFDILEGICRRGMYVEELNTNGYFLNRETLERMRSIGCMPLMKISFDGIGYHDWMRNRAGAEESALRAISLCLESGFRVKVQTNMNRRNRGSMLRTAELLDGMGVDEMRIIRTTEAPRWVQNAGNDCLTLREYCYAAALRSAGDATGAVAESLCGSERAFVERMNEKARQLGLSEKTHFANTSGLFAADNTCTARDMAAIMAAAMEEGLCREALSTVDYVTAATESQPEGIVLRNKYLDWFQEKQPEGFTVTACKNGYIRQSKNCLVSYGTGASGKHYICVTAGAGTAVQLMQDHRLLLSTYGK